MNTARLIMGALYILAGILLIAVMPANIYMVTDHEKFRGIPLWALWLRLPLQLPLIYWAWLYTRHVKHLQ
jgi:uncharacterized membrane protein